MLTLTKVISEPNPLSSKQCESIPLDLLGILTGFLLQYFGKIWYLIWTFSCSNTNQTAHKRKGGMQIRVDMHNG